MHHAGFVLAGGRSSRMGADKALLPYRGSTLIAHVAGVVREAVGNVTIVGSKAKYEFLGWPMVEDTYSDCGPLAGIHAALTAAPGGWILVAACDMPDLTVEFLRSLAAAAEASDADVVMPTRDGVLPEPLCAAYRTTCRDAVELAIRSRILKISKALASVRVEFVRVHDPKLLANANTPADWHSYQSKDVHAG